MEPKYKLTYFNGRGLAEVSRLILAYAKVDYVDRRVETEEWIKMKSFLFCRLPSLQVGDVTITESRAIARYLAREHGLAGKDNLEAAKCDMLVDEFYDIYPELNKWRSDNVTKIEREELKREFISCVYPEVFRRFSHLLTYRRKASFDAKIPFRFVGDQLTWADIAIAYGFQELMRIMDKQIPKNFYDAPNRRVIVEFVNRILGIPTIKAWIDNRPKTNF